jgi:hypothetical protein
MKHRYASSSTQADLMPDGVIERMRRADEAVRPWVDPAFRAQINPDMPEVVGPPAPARGI